MGGVKKYKKEIRINIIIVEKIIMCIHIKGIIWGIKEYYKIDNIFKLTI